MKRCEKIIERLMSEMAFSRSKWVDHVRDFILGGALGEYGCLVISRKINVANNWSYEVETILKGLDRYMDANIIKGKS